MSLLLKNCHIFDTQSPFNGKKGHILVEAGIIKALDSSGSGKRTIDLKGSWVAPGLVDMNANFCDPGFEHKEDLKSGERVAISGGFTRVGLSPATSPVVETKSDVEYILSKSNSVDFMPYAALSEGLRGENMTEILDLHAAGAVAFSEGNFPIWNNELLLKTLQYTQKINGLVVSRAKDPHLSRNTHMHEGKSSTILGLRGEPSISEKIHIAQQLEILRYAGGRIHFTMVSTEEGLRVIKTAKKEGLNVTCDVSINHLVFIDRDVSGFDTRFKVDPPFRTEKDRKALIKGVNDGVVDAIVSGHEPQDRESKYLEFDLAEPGAISIQTVFPALISIQKEIDMAKAMECLTAGPRRVLGLEPASVQEGAKAELAIFDPKRKWILDASTNRSKSENTPFWKKELVGMSLGIINGTKMHLRE